MMGKIDAHSYIAYYTQNASVYTAQLVESQQQSSSFSTIFFSILPPSTSSTRTREIQLKLYEKEPVIYGVHSWTPPFFSSLSDTSCFPLEWFLVSLQLWLSFSPLIYNLYMCPCVSV